MKKENRTLPVVFASALLLFIITASIALPIYIRPFYYAHVEALDLPGVSGFTADRIIEAYNEILDYLTLPGREFSTGTIAHSESGQAHFEDCRFWFQLNGTVLLLSGICLAVFWILRRGGRIGKLRIGRLPASSVAALTALTLLTVTVFLAVTDFDQAFTLFHQLFFPGKENWVFDYREDPIILVLPKRFFMNCAILIGAGILCLSAGILGWNRAHTD